MLIVNQQNPSPYQELAQQKIQNADSRNYL